MVQRDHMPAGSSAFGSCGHSITNLQVGRHAAQIRMQEHSFALTPLRDCSYIWPYLASERDGVVHRKAIDENNLISIGGYPENRVRNVASFIEYRNYNRNWRLQHKCLLSKK